MSRAPDREQANGARPPGTAHPATVSTTPPHAVRPAGHAPADAARPGAGARDPGSPDLAAPAGDTVESRAVLLRSVCNSVADVLALAARPPARLRVQLDGASVELDWSQAPSADPGRAVGTVVSGVVEAVSASAPELPAVVAPLVGTFYRSPAPGEPPFVSVGDAIVVGQQIGIVEAMKLMNAVEADVAGVVTEILVEDAEPVEYGQALLRVAPAEEETGR